MRPSAREDFWGTRGSSILGEVTISSRGNESAATIGSKSSRLGFRWPDSRRESVLFEIPVDFASSSRVTSLFWRACRNLGAIWLSSVATRCEVLICRWNQLVPLLATDVPEVGRSVADFISEVVIVNGTETVDVAIVGAGAAGLSAALVLARAQARVTLIDAGAPRNAAAAEMHGFISRDGIAPGSFLELGRQEVVKYGGVLVPDSVRDVAHSPDGSFELVVYGGAELFARAMLIATGLTDQLPHIPGLRERWGSLVHHCPYCHGYEVRGKAIAVIGVGLKEASMKQASLLRSYSGHVLFISNGLDLTPQEHQRLEDFGIVVVEGTVSHLVGASGSLDGVGLTDGRTVACDVAFVAPRPRANDQILRTLGCEVDAITGLVHVDNFGQTSVAGVWAAGNVVTPTAQVVTAAGAGSASAIAINGWLLNQDLDAATAARP